MIQKIKNFLKRFLPPPVRAFNREVERILAAIQSLSHKQDALAQRAELLENQNKALARQNEALAQQTADLSRQNESLAQQTAALTQQTIALTRQMESQREALDQARDALTQQAEVQRKELAQAKDALTQQAEVQRKELAGAAEQLRLYHEQVKTHGEGIQAAIRQEEARLVQIDETTRQGQKNLADAVERVRRQTVESSRYASEAVWAEIFNNAITHSTWLKNTAFSPGRWAVGYPYLYVMYRVLNEARPKRILELGLGQSTRMIAQYAAAHEGVEHIVVEHDQSWIDFFSNDFQLSPHSSMVQLAREMVPYKEAEAVRVFKGFHDTFLGQTFDFISIDAPLGGDMKQYARIDVLGLLPDCLSQDFVIMIDDTERIGETHTVAEMEQRLMECGIVYKKGRYSGKKDCILISAEHLGFLTSM